MLRTPVFIGENSSRHGIYVQLTQIESVFRSLKSDRGPRPVYHRLEHRVDAHLLVAFLAYCLQVTLKNRLMLYAQGCLPPPCWKSCRRFK